jgi:hypothetical protein
MGCFAVLDIIIIFALKQPEPETTASIPETIQPEQPVFTPTQVEETSENLENTRYQ